MAIGDHLRVHRGAYWHHGVDCGDTVIHYTGEPGSKVDAAIRETGVEVFASDGQVEIM